jgi:hypothetical protein
MRRLLAAKSSNEYRTFEASARGRFCVLQLQLAVSCAVVGLGEGRQGQSRYRQLDQASHLRMRDPATGRGASRKDDRSTHSLTVDLPKTCLLAE